MSVSAKVDARISAELKRYKSILAKAKEKGVTESDTSTIVTDMLHDVFGYEKIENITTEHRIKGTYADIAVMVDGKINFLIEVKSIVTALKDQHVRQAVGYCANEGIEWVILTNAAIWRLYRVQFSQPIEKILVSEIDVLDCDPKDDHIIDCIGCLSIEGFTKEDIAAFAQERAIASKFSIAAVLMGDAMVDSLRKEIWRLSRARLDPDDIRERMQNEIIRPELTTGDDADIAQATLKHLVKLRAKKMAASDADEDDKTSGVTAARRSRASRRELGDLSATCTWRVAMTAGVEHSLVSRLIGHSRLPPHCSAAAMVNIPNSTRQTPPIFTHLPQV